LRFSCLFVSCNHVSAMVALVCFSNAKIPERNHCSRSRSPPPILNTEYLPDLHINSDDMKVLSFPVVVIVNFTDSIFPVFKRVS